MTKSISSEAQQTGIDKQVIKKEENIRERRRLE